MYKSVSNILIKVAICSSRISNCLLNGKVEFSSGGSGSRVSVAEALSSAVRCVQYQVAQATEPPQTAWAVISAVRQLGPLG